MDIDQPNGQNDENQDNSDLLPFDPDYQNAEAQQIISNLPELKDCEFDHNYILHHLEQLEIDPTLCSKFSTATKYFASPEPFVQDLYRKSCYWKQNKDTSMDMEIAPYTTLTKPYYHIENLGLKHPANRPQGKVHFKRVFQFPQGNAEFNYIAKRSALQALKTLDDKPNMAEEVTYKLRADVNNGILVKLSEFLKLPEVVEAGITLEEARRRITPAPIHMVSNINSKSSPVRMVIAPHQPHKVTKQSINDALHAGHHGLPSIQDTILRFRLSVSIALADLSCYYKRL